MVLCREFADFYDYAHGLLHRLHGNELIRAVEVYAAGKNVGAGQALERELGSVGAAAYGADEQFAAQGAALSTLACFVVIPVLMLIL